MPGAHVEVTGAARLHRAASSDRSERGRPILRAAELARRAGKPLDGLRIWATEIQTRAHHNKATCALANKLARVCYAVLRDHTPYGSPQPRQEKKLTRTAFAVAA